MNLAGVLHILWPVLKIGLAAYLGLCLLMFCFQSHYVYFPSRDILTTPAALSLAFEEVVLAAPDGERIAAWFVPAEPPARGTILICHGNGGNIGDRLSPIQTFHRLGLNVFIFDYRGYGKSAGTPSEKGTYQDALGAWNHLTQQRHLPPERIVVFGRSLGGAVAAWLAEQQAPGALILEATFTSLPDLGALVYPYLPVRLLCRYRYNTLAHLRRIRCPVLVAHSREDEMIPFAHGRKLFEAAPEPKVFVTLSGMHNDGEGFTEASYFNKLDEFLTTYFGVPEGATGQL